MTVPKTYGFVNRFFPLWRWSVYSTWKGGTDLIERGYTFRYKTSLNKMIKIVMKEKKYWKQLQDNLDATEAP